MHPIIDFRAEGVKFYFDVKQRLTKIHDNSGVGKTFLCESILAAINTSKDTGAYPVTDENTGSLINTIVIDGLEACTNSVIEKMKCTNSLIIVDEADILLLKNPTLVKSILNNRSSYFIFMLRAMIKGLNFDYTEYAKLEVTQNEIVVKYFS